MNLKKVWKKSWIIDQGLDLNQKDIIIFDDCIPSLLSPWRNFEYEQICKEFENVKIYTTLTTYNNYSQGNGYKVNRDKLYKMYPFLKNKLVKFKRKRKYKSKLAYFLFYNNLVQFYPILIKLNLPFTFTLYPGGGFYFNNPEIDSFLTNVFKNDLCKGVIVNQSCTKQYLIDKGICPDNRIRLIPGVCLNIQNYMVENYVYDKPTDKTNIVFFANKYTPDGSDKGFDTFQKIALELLTRKNDFSFTVIGGFSKSDLIDPKLDDYINFKGMIDETQFESILSQTHLLISANLPFKLYPGAFDGFPLSTAVTAALYGNLNLMTDYFNESEKIDLIDGLDFIKIDTDVNAIVETIIDLNKNKDSLKEKAINGRNKMLKLYHFDSQIVPRISHLKEILSTIE